MATRTAPRATRTTAVGYLRRSTDRQEQSLPDQKKAIERYAAEHGLRVVRFYTDDAISGTSAVGRRAFQQMMADAQGNGRHFDFIVVYDVKRFGRVSNDEAGYYRHVLRMHGVEVRYVSENFNGDGTDDLLRPVKQWQAREESKDLSKVTIRGLLSRVDKGYWMGGVPPHGYDLRYENADSTFLFVVRHMPDGTKQVLNRNGKQTRTLARGESLSISKRDRAKLVPSEPQRVDVIQRIFKMYVEQQKGFKAIADTLNREHVSTPRGPTWSHIYSGKWTDTTVRSILVNQVYTGDMVWNRRTDGRFHKIVGRQAVQRDEIHGARLVPNDESDWIVVRDAHPPLIPRRVFEQARQLRENRPVSAAQRGKPRRPTGAWQGQRSRFILSGLLECAHCGNRYQGYTRVKGRRRKDGSMVRTFSYACGGYITKGASVCQLNPIDQDRLEETLTGAILEFYAPYLGKDGRKKLAAAVREHAGAEVQEVGTTRKRITAEQTRLSKTIQNLLDNITKANREFVDQRLTELRKRRDELQAQLEQLDGLSLSQTELRAMVAETSRFLTGLETTLREDVPEHQRVALRQCVDRARIDKRSHRLRLTLNVLPMAGLSEQARAEVVVKLPT